MRIGACLAAAMLVVGVSSTWGVPRTVLVEDFTNTG
jgi:hypothetical protein